MLLGDPDDLGDGFVIDVGAEQQVRITPVFAERDLHNDRRLVSVDHRRFVQAPAERAMDEELRLRCAFLRVAGHQVPGIDNEVFATLVVDVVLVHPLLQSVWAGEDQYTLTGPQAVACLGTDKPGIVLEILLQHRGRGHPQIFDPNSVVVLVHLGVFQPEEVAETVAVVAVEMGDAHSVVVVTTCLPQVAAQFLWKLAPKIILVVTISGVGVVHEQFASIGKIDAQGVRIAEREEMNVCLHLLLLVLLRGNPRFRLFCVPQGCPCFSFVVHDCLGDTHPD